MTTEPADTVALSNEDRAERAAARRRGRSAELTPLQQMRPFNPNSVPDKSAGAYYLRPLGATIGDVLIWYPNGAKHDRQYDPKGRYSENADYYQMRQRAKGFEYVGPTLTREGARRLVEILEANRDAEVERLEDEIAECTVTVENSDLPQTRELYRRRRQQLSVRLERVRKPFDPDALVSELEEIARAQRMARVAPEVLAVMKEMMEAQSSRFTEALARFTPTRAKADEDPRMQEGVATVA